MLTGSSKDAKQLYLSPEPRRKTPMAVNNANCQSLEKPSSQNGISQLISKTSQAFFQSNPLKLIKMATSNKKKDQIPSEFDSIQKARSTAKLSWFDDESSSDSNSMNNVSSNNNSDLSESEKEWKKEISQKYGKRNRRKQSIESREKTEPSNKNRSKKALKEEETVYISDSLHVTSSTICGTLGVKQIYTKTVLSREDFKYKYCEYCRNSNRLQIFSDVNKHKLETSIDKRDFFLVLSSEQHLNQLNLPKTTSFDSQCFEIVAWNKKSKNSQHESPTFKIAFLAFNIQELGFWLQFIQLKSSQFINKQAPKAQQIQMERQGLRDKRHSVEQQRPSYQQQQDEPAPKQDFQMGQKLIRAHSVADFTNKPNQSQKEENSTHFDGASDIQNKEKQLRRQTSVEQVNPKGSKRPVYKIIDSKTYQSQTLWRGDQSMEGMVLKERKNELALLVGKERYQDRIIALDFTNRLLRVRPTAKPYYDAAKDIQFQQIINVAKVSLDIYKREHLLQNFKSKFVVMTLNRQFIFFAKDPVEREIWVEAFCRVIDFNSTGIYDSTKPSKRYLNLVQEQKNDKLTAKYNVLDTKKPQKGFHDGIETYKSKFLEVNNMFVKGALMKRIQNRQVYHETDFHKKHYELNFNEGKLKCFKYASDDIPEKFYQYTEIRACTELSELQVAQLNEKAEQKRSSSLLRRMVTKQSQGCKWNFAFELELSDRSLELYAPTRIDREKWVNLFQTVAEMNLKLVSIKQITPFQYQKETQNGRQIHRSPSGKIRKEIKEFDLASGAKTKLVKGKPEMQMSGEMIHKYVESWLQRDIENKDEEVGQDQEQDGRLIDQNKMMSRNRLRKHLESVSQHTHRAMDSFVEYYSPSCSLTFRYIEGYLLKEIEGAKRSNPLRQLNEISRKDNFHLRFFRIVFNQGRLCLKTDRSEKKMRSFALDSLTSACSVNSSEEIYLDQDGQQVCSGEQYQSEHLETSKKQPLLQKSELVSRFSIDEKDTEPAWRYCFKISFPERKFLLYAPSRREMETWLRVFKLIIAMNHQKVDMMHKNLFVFENQIQSKNSSQKSGRDQPQIVEEFTTGEKLRDHSEESDQTAGKIKENPLDESTLNRNVVDFGVEVKANEQSNPGRQLPIRASHGNMQIQRGDDNNNRGNTIVNQNITVKNIYKIQVQNEQIQTSGEKQIVRTDHDQKARKTLLSKSQVKRERPQTAKSSRPNANKKPDQIEAAYHLDIDNQRRRDMIDSQNQKEQQAHKPQMNSFFEERHSVEQASSVTQIKNFSQADLPENPHQRQIHRGLNQNEKEEMKENERENVEQIYNLNNEQQRPFPLKMAGTTKSQMINKFVQEAPEKPERTISRKKIKLVKSSASFHRDLDVSTESKSQANMLLLKGFTPGQTKQAHQQDQNKSQMISASAVNFTPIKPKTDLSVIMSKEAQERLKNIIQSQTSQTKPSVTETDDISSAGQSQVVKKRVIRIIKNRKTGEQIDRSVIEKSISRIKLNQQSTDNLASLTPLLNSKAKVSSLLKNQNDQEYVEKARIHFDAAFSRSKSVIHHQPLIKTPSINFYANNQEQGVQNNVYENQPEEVKKKKGLKINILGHLKPSEYNFDNPSHQRENEEEEKNQAIDFEDFTSNPPADSSQLNMVQIGNENNETNNW